MIVRSLFTIDQYELVLVKRACDLVQQETGVSCKVKEGKFRQVRTERDGEEWRFDFSYKTNGKCRGIRVSHMKPTGKIRCIYCKGTTFTDPALAQRHVDEKHDGNNWVLSREYDYMWLHIEPKIYFNSEHSSKLDVDKEKKDKTLKWLNNLMVAAGVKPVPRFSLSDHVKAS